MEINLKQGEAKNITFNIKDEAGNEVDCSSTTCSFVVKTKLGGTALITKADGVFDKTDAASGVLVVNITSTDSDIDSLVYVSQLTITFSATDIIKSNVINFIIEADV